MAWNHPLIVALLAIIGTLAAKYVWDRFLSQSSRITRSECEKNQKICQSEILVKIKNQGDCLDEGDDHFKKLDSVLLVITFTLLKICNKMQIECEDIVKKMSEKGIIA